MLSFYVVDTNTQTTLCYSSCLSSNRFYYTTIKPKMQQCFRIAQVTIVLETNARANEAS